MGELKEYDVEVRATIQGILSDSKKNAVARAKEVVANTLGTEKQGIETKGWIATER